MGVRHGLLAGVVIGALAIAAMPAAALAAVNAYLRLEGVPGDSNDEAHKGWVELNSVSMGMGGGRMESRSDAGSGRSSVHEIIIVKHADKASPKLMEAQARGSHFQQAEIDMVHNGQPYLIYVLSDVVVSGYQMSGGGLGPTESVTLSFDKMEVRNRSEPNTDRSRMMAPMGGMRRP